MAALKEARAQSEHHQANAERWRAKVWELEGFQEQVWNLEGELLAAQKGAQQRSIEADQALAEARAEGERRKRLAEQIADERRQTEATNGVNVRLSEQNNKLNEQLLALQQELKETKGQALIDRRELMAQAAEVRRRAESAEAELYQARQHQQPVTSPSLPKKAAAAGAGAGAAGAAAAAGGGGGSGSGGSAQSAFGLGVEKAPKFPSEDARRQYVQRMQAAVHDIVNTWVAGACGEDTGEGEGEATGQLGQLYTFGSFLLAVDTEDSDVDMLVVVPKQLSRQADFFTERHGQQRAGAGPAGERSGGISRSLAQVFGSDPRVSKLIEVVDAFVPCLKLRFNGVDIDLTFANVLPTASANSPKQKQLQLPPSGTSGSLLLAACSLLLFKSKLVSTCSWLPPSGPEGWCVDPTSYLGLSGELLGELVDKGDMQTLRSINGVRTSHWILRMVPNLPHFQRVSDPHRKSEPHPHPRPHLIPSSPHPHLILTVIVGHRRWCASSIGRRPGACTAACLASWEGSRGRCLWRSVRQAPRWSRVC